MVNRRVLLRAGVVGVSGLLAGCASTVEQLNSDSTETTAREIPDAVFTFDYDQSTQTLQFTFKGGDRPRGGEILIRSSDGTQARWNKLGSTSVTESKRLSEGEEGTLGESVLNWQHPVTVGERIRLIYRPNSDSPATIAEFDTQTAVTVTESTSSPTKTQTSVPTSTSTPSSTSSPTETQTSAPTSTATPTQTTTSTSTSTPTSTPTTTTSPPDSALFEDTFADGSYGQRWTVVTTDDETIREEDGYLLHESPPRYNEQGNMRSIESLTAEGTQTIIVEQKTRSTDYWGYGFGITDGDVAIDFRETRWEDNDYLRLRGGESGNQNVGTATSSTDVIEYTMTVDFDTNTVTQVSRGGETYDTNYNFSSDFDSSYDVHLGKGRGHELEYHTVRVKKSGKSGSEESVQFPIELQEDVGGGLSAVEDQLYAIIYGDPNYLARINPRTEKVVETFDLSYEIGSGLTFDGTHLWVVDFGTGNVIQFDTANGDATVEFQAAGAPAGVGFGDDSLWIGDIAANSIREYGRDGEERSQFSVGSETTNAAGIAYHNDNIWVLDKSGTVYIYTTDGTLLAQHRVFSDLNVTGVDSSTWGVIGENSSQNIDKIRIEDD